MGDLVQFLRDRLDEDEAVALRAGDSFRQIGETGVIVATEGDRAEECASANWAGIAEHIVRHDPARVLAEVQAKRQLLDEFNQTGAVPDTPERRASASWKGDFGYLQGLARAVHLLALPYSDHPNYDKAWRP
jgi:hypothetical protein